MLLNLHYLIKKILYFLALHMCYCHYYFLLMGTIFNKTRDIHDIIMEKYEYGMQNISHNSIELKSGFILIYV